MLTQPIEGKQNIFLLSSYPQNIFGQLILGNLKTVSHECTYLKVTAELWGAINYNDLCRSGVEIALKVCLPRHYVCDNTFLIL